MGTKYVDALYTRMLINDPRDDTLVNAKVVQKGDRLNVIATTDIHLGDEIFIDYDLEYFSISWTVCQRNRRRWCSMS